MGTIELRRKQLGKGKYEHVETVVKGTDCDGWTVRVDRKRHKITGEEHMVIHKWRPDGKYYFCERVTLQPATWNIFLSALRKFL